RLTVVRGDGGVLELDRRLPEGTCALHVRAEVETGLWCRLRAQRRADRREVLPFLAERRSREHLQLACQSRLLERLLVERHLRVLELEHELQDLLLPAVRRAGERVRDI